MISKMSFLTPACNACMHSALYKPHFLACVTINMFFFLHLGWCFLTFKSFNELQ